MKKKEKQLRRIPSYVQARKDVILRDEAYRKFERLADGRMYKYIDELLIHSYNVDTPLFSVPPYCSCLFAPGFKHVRAASLPPLRKEFAWVGLHSRVNDVRSSMTSCA